MKISGAVLFALLLLGITLFFVLGAFGHDPVAREVPLLVGIPVAALLVLQLLARAFPKLAARLSSVDTRQILQVNERLLAHAKAVQQSGPSKGKEVEYFVWTGALVVAIYLVGFLITTPLFLFVLLWLRSGEKLTVALLIAAAMWGIAYFGFTQVMEIPLFKGVLLN